MDRNLFLLDPSEIEMIQEINTIGEKGGFTLLQQNFCFKKVKDFSNSLPVDLVILRENFGENGMNGQENCKEGWVNVKSRHRNGYQPLIADLKDEEEAIRAIIDNERERRRQRGRGQNNEYQEEEWPRLGNYESNDNCESNFTQIDDDHFLPDYTQIYDDSPYSEWCKTPRMYDESMEFLLEDRSPVTEIGRLNNFALIQLDARLGRVKWYLSNLAKGCSGCFNKTSWSASTTGCYVVKYDKEGKVIRRTIYLLIDVIESVANADGVTRDTIIAEVYIHEMFHAYYDNIKRKNLINVYLKGVPEIEEPMAEFGMLIFMDKYKPTFLSTALKNVSSKLSCGDCNIQFYGLGAELFKYWHPYKGNTLEIYQKIMPSPRLSIRLVNMYVHEARSPHFASNKCLKMVQDIVEGFDYKIASIHKHYKYNGKDYGQTCRVICDVLKSYADKPGSTFSQMEKDFQNANPIYGRYGIFAIRKGMPDNIANNYNLRYPITLKDGTIIVVRSVWSNNKGGNAETFFNRVNILYKRGILLSSVDILA